MSQPKVQRVMLTVLYADGSSIMMDVKDPANCEFDEVVPELDTLDLYDGRTMSSRAVEMTIKVHPDRPALFSVYPIRGQL